MSFLTGWRDALAGTGGVIGHGFGGIMDWATGDNNGIDPRTGEARPSEWNKMMADVSKTFGGAYEGLGPVGQGMKWVFEKDYELYSKYISRPFSTAVTVASLADSPTWKHDQDRGELGAWFDSDTWSRAYKIAEHRSPGQALTLMGTADILDTHEVADMERHWWFHLVSGTADAAVSLRLDPLGMVGKGVKATRVHRTTTPLPTHLSQMGASKEVTSATNATEDLVPTTPGAEASIEDALWPPKPAAKPGQQIVEKPPMVRTLDWMQKVADKAKNPGEAARTIEKHPMLAESPNSGLIASMMADSTRGDKDLIANIATGDGAAFHELSATRADLAKRLKLLHDVNDDLIKVETVRPDGTILSMTDKAMDADRLKNIQLEIDALDSRRKWINDLIGPDGSPKPGVFGSVQVRAKGLGYDKIATAGASARGAVSRFASRGAVAEKIHYYNQFNAPIRVIAGLGMSAVGQASHFVHGQKPRGYLDTNDAEGWRELDSTLARVKGFSPERRSEWVGKYMRATSEGAKLQIANDAERSALTHIMNKAGLKAEDAGKIIDEHFLQRNKGLAMLRNRAYAATQGVDGVRIDFVDSENAANAALPVVATQLANKVPLADMDRMQQAVFRHRHTLQASFAKNVNDPLINLSDILSSVWKTSTLMRFGYMIRVLTDDEMAYVAKLGAMTALKPAGEGATNWAYNRYVTNKLRTQRAIHRNVEAFKTGKSTREIEENIPKELTTFEKREVGKKSEKVILGAEKLPSTPLGLAGAGIKRLAGKPEREAVEFELQGFAPPGKEGEYWRGLSSDDRSMMEMDANSRLRTMRQEMAHGHGLVNLGDDNYYQAWSRALNLQLGQDEMAKKLLKGESPEDVVKWLRRDEVGRAYADRMPFRAADPERWVANVDTWIQELAPRDELRKMALKGEVNESAIRKTFTDENGRFSLAEHPQQIAGGLLDANIGRGAWAEQLNNIVRGFYNRANQMPTDTLIRHPLAKSLYETRRNESIERFMASGGAVDNIVLRKLENQARAFTVKEIHKVVLDLSAHSNAAHVFRFVAPFYNAWDKALRRWGRLAYGDPSIIFKGNRIWQGLENMPVLFGEESRLEDSEGRNLTGKFSGLSNAGEQLITFRLPQAIAKKIGATVLDQVQIPKASLNLVLQGDPWYLPGFGPFVQVPASKFVENKPGYAEMLKSILPFGPQKTSDLVTPTSVRKLGQWKNEDDQNYQSLMINIWRTRYAEWTENGKVGPAPNPLDPQIKKDANHMRKLMFFTQVFAPFNVRYTTPYKFYIDQYHRMLSDKNIGPENARDAFIKKHPEYFLFAESTSKNNARLPATLEAWNKSKKYRDLLAKAPDIAPVVLGSGIDGDFNAAVYRAQFEQKLSPSSTETVREPQSLKEFAHGSEVDQGWNKYNQYMELLRVELSNRNLLSYQQKGAEDLRAIKQAVVAHIRKQNPTWAAEYDSYDKQKQQTVMDQLHAVTQFKPLQGRQEIQTLTQYLFVRDAITGELQRRDQVGGSASIVAGQNSDLASAWEYERDRIAESDPVFSKNIFDRYLASDTLVGV